MRIQHENGFWNIIKWFFLATFIGAVVGGVDALFLKTLDKSIAWRNQFQFYYLGLPFFLYIIWLLAHKALPKSQDYSTDAVIEKINTHRCVDLFSALKALFLSVFTMTVGGSAGKEAPCADAGAGVASFFGQFFRMNLEDQRKMMICGVSAGFAGVFGEL